MKTGIALLNFGGPWTIKDVKPFLYRLFVNPAVLVGVPTPVRHLLAFTISQVKGPSAIRNYQSIGGASPQLKWTRIQAEGLQKVIGDDSFRVEVGMRSAEPSIEVALSNLKEWGADRLILFPLFPHFSTTTTGTCLQEARDSLQRLNWKPDLYEIKNWPDHNGYIMLLRRTVDEAIEKAEMERNGSTEPIHILFSAHSLPMKIVKLGDPYPDDVDRTIKEVTKNLEHPWSLCFQSRNGRLPWLQPYTEDELKRLGKEGIKRVVIVPISFVSDHIETLYELDQLYADLAKEHGISHYYRARTFNDDPEFPHVLHSILKEIKI
jgi:protoporphyrin/coproporphyrin ferrochelatase